MVPLLASGQISVPVANVEGQPLAANIQRVRQTLEYLGRPLPENLVTDLDQASRQRDSRRLQELIDPLVLLVVSLNPEVRVSVTRGPATAKIQQAAFTPHLIKVINRSTVSRRLQISSPQAGPVYAGAATGILKRQQQTELIDNANVERSTDRFLSVEMFRKQPMTPELSGLEVEYAIGMISCSESGKREAMIGFDVGSGTQDIGFRGQVPVLFEVLPARQVRLWIRDFDGQPTTARLTIRDRLGRIYPSQLKRLAPDFFFQPQIYRDHGDSVLLPPGEFEVTFSRGPEYRNLRKSLTVMGDDEPRLDLRLERWVNPMEYGFYCGDHHIHGAGCSHYDNPTQGVRPIDMFAQVKGEGLNVGCVLTWGPCFDFQRRFFTPQSADVSEPLTQLKYDLEISGFGSAAMGHVCLLNLANQTFPGTDGTTEGWPTWTVPVMRWAKRQGAVTGYPHSALHVDPAALAQRWIRELDHNTDESLARSETSSLLLPRPFDDIDVNSNGQLDFIELEDGIEAAANELPNLCVPEMNGAGAMEIFVSTAEGVCDFISAMNTERIPELNTWYHLMNCGFPLKLSGETDFPCMSSRRVGQGRVYVHLGEQTNVDFSDWVDGLRRGKSYVSDGFAHALEFSVDDQSPGNQDVRITDPGLVKVRALVAFAAEQPRTVAQGAIMPAGGRRLVGDTRYLHAKRNADIQRGGQRTVEVVVNGKVVYQQDIAADGRPHPVECEVRIDRSSWVALRQFPQLHTNPVNVLVEDQPIRGPASSAQWCIAATERLWNNRSQFISANEQPEAKRAYDRAIKTYQLIASEMEQGLK